MNEQLAIIKRYCEQIGAKATTLDAKFMCAILVTLAVTQAPRPMRRKERKRERKLNRRDLERKEREKRWEIPSVFLRALEREAV